MGRGRGEIESYESETYPLKLPLKKASFNSSLNTPTEKIVHFCTMPKKIYGLHNVRITLTVSPCKYGLRKFQGTLSLSLVHSLLTADETL